MPVKAAALGSFTKVGRLAIQLVSLLFSFFRKENEKSILSKKKTKTLINSLDVSHCSTCAPILSLRYFDFLGAVLMVCAYGMEWFGQPAYYKYRH